MIIIVVLLVAAVSGAGWYVYNNHNKTKVERTGGTNSYATTSKSASTVAPVTVDLTAGWTAYSNAKGAFSLKYPVSWVTATNPELCSDGIVLLGPNAASVGKCGSDFIGQIYVTSSDGDSRTDRKLSSSLYVDITTESVTVTGVTGQKQTGTSKDTSGMEAIGSVPDGSKNIIYIFYTNGKTYVAQYIQRPTDTDVHSDFDLLVTKTLKFSS